MFSLNNHIWTTKFDPSEGAAPYEVHPSILSVIGGDRNGNASIQTPLGGFSQHALGILFGAQQELGNTASNPTSIASDDRQKKGLDKGVLEGTTIAAIFWINPDIGPDFLPASSSLLLSITFSP